MKWQAGGKWAPCSALLDPLTSACRPLPLPLPRVEKMKSIQCTKEKGEKLVTEAEGDGLATLVFLVTGFMAASIILLRLSVVSLPVEIVLRGGMICVAPLLPIYGVIALVKLLRQLGEDWKHLKHQRVVVEGEGKQAIVVSFQKNCKTGEERAIFIDEETKEVLDVLDVVDGEFFNDGKVVNGM